MNKLRVLVVDDEPDLGNVIRYNLSRRGHEVQVADSAEAAQAMLASDALPDLIVSDVMMPGIDGFELCRRLRANERTQDIPLIFLTGRAAPADRVEGFQAGCDDYLPKPFDMNELMLRVEALGKRIAWARTAATNIASAPSSPKPPSTTQLIEKLTTYEARYPALKNIRRNVMLGSSPVMVTLLEEILIQSMSKDPVLIVGESGTGKTLVAEALWKLGPRAEKPFRTVNCAELQAADPLVVMGRLFGFGRNSGLQNVPKEGQPGMLEECAGGTLFLDEVALLPPQAQALLLLPAEGRPFNPAAGRGDPVTVDVQLVFATNRDLHSEARAGRFPLDLLMRIGQAVIRLPPLRDRPEDLVELTQHFVQEASAELGKPAMRASHGVVQEVTRRPWPGNVRELRAALRDAVRRAAFHDAKEVLVEHLPQVSAPSGIAERSTTPAVAMPAMGMGQSTSPAASQSQPPSTGAVDFTASELAELAVLRRHRFQIAPSEAELGLSQKSRTLTNHLRGFCFKALARTGFNVGAAAHAVVGSSDEALIDRMQARIHQYLVTVRENVGAGTDDRLFNNLPRDYHRAMEEAVARARAGTLPAAVAPAGPLDEDASG